MKQLSRKFSRQKKGLTVLGFVYLFCYLPATAATPKVAELLEAMTKQYSAGQFVQAGHTGQQILTVDPNNLTAHYLLGNIFLKADVLDSAGREYEWCIAHGAGTKIGSYAKNALDVMEGKVPPPGGLTGAAGMPGAVGASAGSIPQTRGQAAQLAGQQNLPTQFFNPYNPNQTVNGNPNYLPQGQIQQGQAQTLAGPLKVQVQAGEYSQRAMAQGQSFIEGKRQTMEGSIKRINEEAKSDIRSVPKYIYYGRERIVNPNYDSAVQSIKDAAADKIATLQADFDNEQNKIGSFYKKVADSYDKQSDSAMSQAENTRPHHVIDADPNMFVRNYGKTAK
jgi:hypothetical protein